ncbi:putative glycoside hydrolase [Sedimentibacter sp. MB31-C6]|uniref:putative glycoside hydrolase n=1 Tax=Sedimentibacter sp. MB31-C6 TaxID=3109366 RepID=UPI002DDD04CE|nr:putative glycoside hydrolase [Sedimentibacter sp. MB36-C1]WSI03362.1 putative glycoside hydrolase [Sedimentibacter sp. MB36-C1]
MTKKIKCAIIFLLLSIILTACSNPVQGNTSTPEEEEILEPSEENHENEEKDEISEEEKAKLELEKKIAEREELEKKRKEELGEFYVPLVPIGEEREKTPVEVKALYATGYTAGNELNRDNIDAYGEYVKALADNDTKKINELYPKAEAANKFERIVGLAIGTEINAIVINVKDDNGFITYESQVKIVQDMNENTPIPIKDINNMIEILNEYDIYTIGRIVAFKDKNFAVLSPEHSIQLKTGGTWLDPNSGNIPWINPFDKYVWDYNIAIAKEAALLGFDEIQFDYVRFPDGAKHYNPITEFPGRDGRDKDEAVADFLEYAYKELEPYNVFLGADVFGLITRTWDDYPEDIGQTWILMGEHVDNMAPMVYPSHYSTGWYNLENPNAEPYLVVKGAMEEALEKNSSMEKPPIIRPWIQDFDWAGIEYGPKKIRDQIIAAKELGINEYMIWNPANSYDPYSYILSDIEKKSNYPVDKGELDYKEKSPSDAADKYLSGMMTERYSYMYLMTPVGDRDKEFEKFVEIEQSKGNNLLNYKVYSYQIDENDENKATVDLYYKLETTKNGTSEIIEKDNVKWVAIKENNIWKIQANFN